MTHGSSTWILLVQNSLWFKCLKSKKLFQNSRSTRWKFAENSDEMNSGNIWITDFYRSAVQMPDKCPV